MCGPTSAENALQASSQNFASMLQQNYGTLFSNQMGVLNAINNSLSPILAAGPSQRGFSGAQTSQMQTQAINATAAATRAAQQAARTAGAGQGGGGTSGLTSGIQQQIAGSIASQGAQAEATQLGNIEAADWATGRQNYWQAQGGMDALAKGYSPDAAMSGAISENQQSFGQANQIQQQQNQEAQMIAGGITSLAGAAATGGISMANNSNFMSQLGGGTIFGSGGFFG